MVVVFARDEADGRVKAFAVQKDAEGRYPQGYEPTVIRGKFGKRAINQADIEIRGLRVSEDDRLPGCDGFSGANKVLAVSRGGSSWEALGHAMAAYELAVSYAAERVQFSAPIASYQLVQEKLAGMLADTVSIQMMCHRMAELQMRHELTAPMASMVKMFTCRRSLDVCRTARDIMAGNGMLIENHVGRHLTDMEVVYTYEGTDSMQALIVGRDITGHSAFTGGRR
ncbi:acyl-CoA dehydrogenase family protein [Micrococcus luteus]|uniref:acyl-CoA dehydrogenase family protein n=1 Tax=Micrococcus luteus TaxID=1270 RepID=UPI003879FDDA